MDINSYNKCCRIRKIMNKNIICLKHSNKIEKITYTWFNLKKKKFKQGDSELELPFDLI